MTDRDIITGYRDNVFTYQTIRRSIEWNQRYGLPLLDLPERLCELLKRIQRFEDILSRIPDRRTRNILRCRYALGWTVLNVSDYMNLDRNTISKISTKALRRIC